MANVKTALKRVVNKAIEKHGDNPPQFFSSLLMMRDVFEAFSDVDTPVPAASSSAAAKTTQPKPKPSSRGGSRTRYRDQDWAALEKAILAAIPKAKKVEEYATHSAIARVVKRPAAFRHCSEQAYWQVSKRALSKLLKEGRITETATVVPHHNRTLKVYAIA